MSKRKLTEDEANVLIRELANDDLGELSYDDLKSRFLYQWTNYYQSLTDDELIEDYLIRHKSLPFNHEGEI